MKPSQLDMHPVLSARYDVYVALCDQIAHVKRQLNCVKRTKAEQSALHAQGRLSLKEVNRLRILAGMAWQITAAENAYKVTWTMNSKHFPAESGPNKGLCRAFDDVVLKDGCTPSWDVKWDGDKDKIGDYEELARCAEQAGLVAGARWDKPDYPHFQLPDDVA